MPTDTRVPLQPPPSSLAAMLHQLTGANQQNPAATQAAHASTKQETSMRQLNFDFKQIGERNRDGSYATQADRSRILAQVANLLHELGYRDLRAENLKPKHIDAVVEHWKIKELCEATIKNRLAALRWLAEKIGKPNIVKKTNAEYGISKREYVTNISKARDLDPTQLQKITEEKIILSLNLQAHFGVRFKESIVININWADRGDHLVLKGSWCKGGREREIPIRTDSQRQLVDQIKVVARGGSLVGDDYKTYKAYLQHFKYVISQAGISNVHGHRHFYAQTRYKELTGRDCPACGGSTAKNLSVGERAIDREARLIISNELGHSREQITAVYLGR